MAKSRETGSICSVETIELSLYQYIPARLVFVTFSFFGLFLANAYRAVINVALVAMVGQRDTVRNRTHLSDTCQFNYTHISDAYPSTRAEFGHWDDSTQALILSAFSYGYVLTQLPAGVVVVRYGGKWLLALSLLISALLSLLSTMAARLDYRLFIVTRIGLGLCDGVIYPSVYAMIGQWMPEWERCRGTAIILSGGSVGTIVATQLAGVLCEGHLWGGWPAVFYLQGIAGCVWFVLWSALVFESPEEHPYITVDEYEYIVVNQNPDNHKRRVMPWKGMLTSIPFYALTIAHICNDWTSYTMEALLPIYLANVLKLSVKRTALMSSLTYLSQTVIAWIAAHISDNLRESNFDINIIRKTNHAIAYLGPALFLLGVIYARCHTTAIIAMFIVATGLNGCHFSSLKSTHVDMAPDFAGTLYGVTNSMAGVSGLIAPQFAAYFLNNGHTLTNWSIIFYTTIIVYILGTVIYLVFGSAKVQDWAVDHNTDTIQLGPKKNGGETFEKSDSTGKH